MNEDNNIEIPKRDWDGDMIRLLDEIGVPADQAHGPDRREILVRRAKAARPAIAAVVVVVPGSVVVLAAGAPVTAGLPVVLYGLGWIGYGIWLSAGRPAWSVIRRGAARGVELLIRAVLPHLVRARGAVAARVSGPAKATGGQAADAPF